MTESAPVTSPAVSAADPSRHRLAPNVVTLPQSVIIGIASAAPTASVQVTIGVMVAVTAYATVPAIFFGMLPMLAIALCYQRLNLWEQNCGGPYAWVTRAINPYLGYMVGWIMLMAWLLGSVSDVLPLGPLVLSFVGINTSAVVGNMITATLFGAAVTWVAARGIKTTARFQLSLAFVEYGILIVFSFIAFWAVYIGHWSGTQAPSAHWFSLSGVGGSGSLAGGMLIAIFLFAGWDTSVYINEESEKKKLNPGRACLISVAILGPLSIWLFLAFQGVVSKAALEKNSGDALPFIASRLVGPDFAKFMVVAVILSVIATTQAAVVSIARISYSMGTDRLLPKPFASVHRRYQTPAWGTVFWGLLIIIVADLYVVSSTLGNAFATVVESQSLLVAAFYVFAGIATVVYYRRIILRSVADFFLVGVFPVAGAGALVWVIVKSVPSLGGAARWSAIGVLALGLVAMAVTAIATRPPLFRLGRSAYVEGVEPSQIPS